MRNLGLAGTPREHKTLQHALVGSDLHSCCRAAAAASAAASAAAAFSLATFVIPAACRHAPTAGTHHHRCPNAGAMLALIMALMQSYFFEETQDICPKCYAADTKKFAGAEKQEGGESPQRNYSHSGNPTRILTSHGIPFVAARLPRCCHHPHRCTRPAGILTVVGIR